MEETFQEVKVKVVEISSLGYFERIDLKDEEIRFRNERYKIIKGIGALHEFDGFIEIDFRTEDLDKLKEIFEEVLITKKILIKI